MLGLSIPRHSEAGREREIYLEPEEAQALVAAAEPAFRPVLLAALHTAMRRGEMIALRWRVINFKRKDIVVESATAKSKKKRVIPLPHDLEDVLRQLRNSRKVSKPDGSDAVFTLEDSTPITADMIRGMMRRALKNCDGIPSEKKAKVTFHCLRHTSASFMAQGGASLFEIAKILGHSSLAMTMRYAHFCPQRGKSAVDGVGQFLTPSGQSASGSA